MAFEFLHEVDRHGPKHPEVNSTERSVLRCLANDLFYYPHREVNLSHEHIADYVGMAADSVGPTLRKMARKGIEVRVPIGVDKNGKDLFAVPGKTPRFRLPDYAQPEHCDVCRKRKGAQVSPLDGHKGGQAFDLRGTGVRPRGDRRSTKGGQVFAPLRSRTNRSSPSDDDACRDERRREAAELFQRENGLGRDETLRWLRKQDHADPEMYIEKCLKGDNGENLRGKIERDNAADKPTPIPPAIDRSALDDQMPASDEVRRQAIEQFAQTQTARLDAPA